MQCI